MKLGCGDKSKVDYKYLNKKWPGIQDAPDPSLINWQNLGYGSMNRCIRSLFVNLFCLIIVLGSFYLILQFMKLKEKGAADAFKPAECGSAKFDKQKAWENFLLPPEKRGRPYQMACHCF